MKLPRIEVLAKKIALDVLKAYHREMKSAGGTAVEREAGQSSAFAAARKQVYDVIGNFQDGMIGKYQNAFSIRNWLNEAIEDD